MKRIIQVFIFGMKEYREGFTYRYECDTLDDIYMRGKRFAHKLTFRLYETEEDIENYPED